MNLAKLVSTICITTCYTGFAFSQSTSTGTDYESLVNNANEYYAKSDWKHAISAYKKAMADTSTNSVLWQKVATASQMLGDNEAALTFYKKSLIYKPSFYQSTVMQHNILSIYNKQKDYKSALAFLSDAVSKGYSNFPAFDTLSVFKINSNAPEYQAILNKAKLNAYPCLSEPHSRDFDFWVGDWDVCQTGSKVVVGRSKITKVDGDCVVMEDFTSLITPQSGHSINYYDPTKKKWEQVYSGSGGGHQLYDEGEYKDGKMAFHYQSTFKNKPYDGHFFFYNVDANTVRQVQDFSTDGGKTYQTAYDFTYTRRK